MGREDDLLANFVKGRHDVGKVLQVVSITWAVNRCQQIPAPAEVHQLSRVQVGASRMTHNLARPVDAKRPKRRTAHHREVAAFGHCARKTLGELGRQETPKGAEDKVPPPVDLLDL